MFFYLKLYSQKLKSLISSNKEVILFNEKIYEYYYESQDLFI